MRKERSLPDGALTGPRRSGSAREIEIFAIGHFAVFPTQST
jgi:hypothetical protein